MTAISPYRAGRNSAAHGPSPRRIRCRLCAGDGYARTPEIDMAALCLLCNGEGSVWDNRRPTPFSGHLRPRNATHHDPRLKEPRYRYTLPSPMTPAAPCPERHGDGFALGRDPSPPCPLCRGSGREGRGYPPARRR